MRQIKEGSHLIHDESGQGTTEYILMLVGVVIVAMVFKGRIKEVIDEGIEKATTEVGKFTSDPS